jgi:cell division protein FtsW
LSSWERGGGAGDGSRDGSGRASRGGARERPEAGQRRRAWDPDGAREWAGAGNGGRGAREGDRPGERRGAGTSGPGVDAAGGGWRERVPERTGRPPAAGPYPGRRPGARWDPEPAGRGRPSPNPRARTSPSAGSSPGASLSPSAGSNPGASTGRGASTSTSHSGSTGHGPSRGASPSHGRSPGPSPDSARGDLSRRRDPARDAGEPPDDSRPGPSGASRPRQRASAPGGPRQAPDYLLLLIVAALVSIGMVMVYSASSVEGAVAYHDPAYFLKRQLAGLVVGVLALLFCMNFPYWNWRRLAPAILAATLGMLLLVLVPHIGIEVGGARRWLGFHSLRIQPSEIAKLSLIIYFADWLARAGPRIQRVRTGILPYMALVAVIAGVILAEPDLGTAAAIAGTSLIMLFLAGVPIRHLVATAVAAVPVLAYAILGSAYRRARFLAFLNPQADALGSGYHIMQALYALGSGGLFGLGLGLSRQKYFYLPEQHTDFIFAILGEELGLIGGLLLLALFLLLIWRGYRIAVSAPDTFSSLLAAGVTTMVAVQVVVNVGVVTSVLPITGITLPFISFGSSSLVFMLAGMGILCNVSRYARL